MAEEKDTKVTQEKEVVVDNSKKTPEIIVDKETSIAPATDKPVVDSASEEAPKPEDIADVVELLNIMDQEVGGKGGITQIPPELKGSIQFLVEKLTFVRDLFEDPKWKAILDDLADQKEDGETPSLEVAVARTMPLDKLMELADNEDYASTQSALAESLDTQKNAEEEEAMYQANFEESQKAGEEYSNEMGYDEARKNELFQKVLDLFKVMGDGKLTKVEFAEVDKMLNYGPDTERLTAQISKQDTKEVLPDKASVDATLTKSNPAPKAAKKDAPGMASIGYNDTAEWEKTGKKRFSNK